MKDTILIIDFGSQYTQLITRKMRELGFKSIISTFEDASGMLEYETPLALILSGGPQSIFEDRNDYSKLFNKNIPVLGICYGMQIISQFFEGLVERGKIGEYGEAIVSTQGSFSIPNVPKNFSVWMSHFDEVVKAPPGFEIILKSSNNLIAGIQNLDKKILGLQYHPEVKHSTYGDEVLKYFTDTFIKKASYWDGKAMYEEALSEIKKVNGSKVLCAFSGGVDSLVAAALASTELKDDLYCFFVDHGLLRPQDLFHIHELKNKTNLNIEIIDAKNIFLKRLEGISDPEKKRKIIGTTFIDVFEEKVHEYERDQKIHFEYLLQGTLYPDVIESISPHKKGGKSVTIKSHHNVGGLPERMNLKLLEPFRFMFKDEVRAIGKTLKLEEDWVYRHPFPGPGLGVRILGEVTEDKIRKVQESDQILYEELKKKNEYKNSWQAFTVLLPIKTVGVKGDERVYEEIICLRMVNSEDGMTATFTPYSWEFLGTVSRRITNEVKGVTRVVYDITNKPPGTIEWE